MKNKRKSRPSENNSGNPLAWMVTFADLMTLLITFFVLLLSMSSMDSQKLKDMFGYLSGAFGVLEYGQSMEVGEPAITRYKGSPAVNEADQLRESILLLQDHDEDLDIPLARIEVFSDHRGIVVRLPSAILFDKGSIKMSADAYPYLNKLGDFLAGSGRVVRVEGHTDSQTVSSDSFRSNWDISMGRAITVLKYLIERGALSPEGYSVVAYADSRPVASNENEEGKARNRRVEVVLSKRKG